MNLKNFDSRKQEWRLTPDVLHLSHGSYGATPTKVLQAQQQWRERTELSPDAFFTFEIRSILRSRRALIAEKMNAHSENLVFMQNATSAVNSVLRSMHLSSKDEIVFTNHIYPTVFETLKHLKNQFEVNLVQAAVPFPLKSPDQIHDAIFKCVHAKTRLLVVDHITSPTALIFPLEKIIATAHQLGVKVLVDGAHAPGMIPLQLEALHADFYVGNLHKWMCAAKGSAFLYVDPKWHTEVFPLTITQSQGTLAERFEWAGTWDASAWLSLDTSLEFFESLKPTKLQNHNHALIQQARLILADAVKTHLPHPDANELYGSMACIKIPFKEKASVGNLRKLRRDFFEKYRVEVPFTSINEDDLYVRPSAQCYNSIEDYETLAVALKDYFLAR